MTRRSAILALPLLLASMPLHAQPSLAVYQGYVVDADGEPVDGLRDMFFRVYATETGGTPVWSHAQSDVVVTQGSFAVELPVDAADLSQPDLWLAMAVESQSDELAPRQRIASMPWALLCGNALRLGGQALDSFQATVTGSCSPGSAVRTIHPTGLVDCDTDDAQGVASVTAGLGLVGNDTIGDVIVDVGAGPGVQTVGDTVGLIFGGSGGLDEAARADHTHTDYLPLGSTLTCDGTDKVVAISPDSGDVECAPDQDTTYGIVPGGNLTMLPGNVLQTEDWVSLSGYIFARDFRFVAPKTGYISLHPSDFNPYTSDYDDYFASKDGPGFVQSQNDASVLAPLHLPEGATVTGWEFSYRAMNDLDMLCCTIRALHMGTNPIIVDEPCFDVDPPLGCCSSNTGGAPVTLNVPIPPDIFPAFDRVTNQDNAYIAECFFVDDVPVQDLQLIGLRVFYTYDQL